jgi:predicted dehydrogenase
LDYGKPENTDTINVNRKIVLNTSTTFSRDKINVGILGIGNFAQSVHLPNLRKLADKYNIYALASQSGVKAKNAGEFFKARYITTQYDEIINDPEIDLVMICTRHGNHASLTIKALNNGKHVFVEKPLSTTMEDLSLIEKFFSDNKKNTPLLMVGFNRRFSPYIAEIKKHTDKRIGPLYIHYRINAGYQPADHWTHGDGGRIIGEACHIVDLVLYITGSRIDNFSATDIHSGSSKFLSNDNKVINLKFADGSVAVIEYVSMGSRSMPKEYLEIHFDEKSISMDDYKLLSSFGFKIKKLQSGTSNKGHYEELATLYNCLKDKNTSWPIDLQDMIDTTKTVIQIS